MLHLVRNCKTICESGIFYMPISSLWEFQFIQMFATPDIVSRFKYSNMYESIFVISFFISLMTNNAENCVHVLVCHLCIFFWRSTVQIDCQIFQWVVCGFIIKFWKFFIYPEYKSFIRYVICKHLPSQNVTLLLCWYYLMIHKI